MCRAHSPLIAVLFLLFLPTAAGAFEVQRFAWSELDHLVGKRVSIPLYDGCAVSGKITAIDADALVIDVSKSSHPQVYPKGSLRVPRATLYVLDVHHEGIRHRVTGTLRIDSAPRTTTIQIVP